jgi:protoporphyrinogen oxidase
MERTRSVQGWQVYSQDESVIPDKLKILSLTKYLPVLLSVATAIENATHYKWLVTSYLRDSPSHSQGVALDIHPDISEDSKPLYAVTNMSDPVFYKREPLIRALQQVSREVNIPNYTVAVVIESDHLHLHIFNKDTSLPSVNVFKWKEAKPVYKDTYERMQLPMTSVPYPAAN